MAVTYDLFIDEFPEFEGAPKGLVEKAIAKATRRVDAEVFRNKADDAIGFLTAHFLSMSSFGQHARLVPKNAKATREDALTTYEREFRTLVRTCTSGFRVTG